MSVTNYFLFFLIIPLNEIFKSYADSRSQKPVFENFYLINEMYSLTCVNHFSYLRIIKFLTVFFSLNHVSHITVLVLSM